MNNVQILNKVFEYNGCPVTFCSGDNVMINATEMAKPFGKRPSKWLELPSTKEFLSALQTIRKSDSLIQTAEGKSGGTWMHEDVAIDNNNEPLFCLADVCAVIGIKDTSRCASYLDDDVRQTHPIKDSLIQAYFR